MSLHQTFRVNAPAVVSEAFEDEVVIIHLESGAYYSLDQCGAAIWQLLQQGVDLTEISTRLGAAYQVNPTEIAPFVSAFIAELTGEQLVVPDILPAPPLNGVLGKALAQTGGAAKALFTRPVLTKFTDMQDLLLLDPIHDVNSSGWPAKK